MTLDELIGALAALRDTRVSGNAEVWILSEVEVAEIGQVRVQPVHPEDRTPDQEVDIEVLLVSRDMVALEEDIRFDKERDALCIDGQKVGNA